MGFRNKLFEVVAKLYAIGVVINLIFLSGKYC